MYICNDKEVSHGKVLHSMIQFKKKFYISKILTDQNKQRQQVLQLLLLHLKSVIKDFVFNQVYFV